jgi:hypothetical protein
VRADWRVDDPESLEIIEKMSEALFFEAGHFDKNHR